MKLGLLIGINYTSVPECTLQGCINDINNMKQVLISQYGYDPSNICMLRDDDKTKMPTRAAMLAELSKIVIASKSTLCTEVWIIIVGMVLK
jgi:metacaspase-1